MSNPSSTNDNRPKPMKDANATMDTPKERYTLRSSQDAPLELKHILDTKLPEGRRHPTKALNIASETKIFVKHSDVEVENGESSGEKASEVIKDLEDKNNNKENETSAGKVTSSGMKLRHTSPKSMMNLFTRSYNKSKPVVNDSPGPSKKIKASPMPAIAPLKIKFKPAVVESDSDKKVVPPIRMKLQPDVVPVGRSAIDTPGYWYIVPPPFPAYKRPSELITYNKEDEDNSSLPGYDLDSEDESFMESGSWPLDAITFERCMELLNKGKPLDTINCEQEVKDAIIKHWESKTDLDKGLFKLQIPEKPTHIRTERDSYDVFTPRPKKKKRRGVKKNEDLCKGNEERTKENEERTKENENRGTEVVDEVGDELHKPSKNGFKTNKGSSGRKGRRPFKTIM